MKLNLDELLYVIKFFFYFASFFKSQVDIKGQWFVLKKLYCQLVDDADSLNHKKLLFFCKFF